MKFMKNIFVCFVFIFAGNAFAQGIINNGGRIVFSGAANIYIDGNTAGDYLSQAGGLINPSTTGIIYMEGDWTNNSANTGFGSDNGTVIMNGANQTINGTSQTTFYNLSLQGSGVKTQNLNTNVGGVTTTNGVLSVGNVVYNLNSFTLTITNPAAAGVTYGTGYIQSETAASFNPSIMQWNMGASTGAHVFPFGTAATQLPFTFNKTSAVASNISVSTRATGINDNLPWSAPVTHMFSPVIGANGSIPVVIDRWWDIYASASTNADITFSYRGTENTLSAPYNIGSLGAQNWNTAWLPPVGASAAQLAGVGNVTAAGLTILPASPGSSPWVLSSLTAPLPIELIDFSAACAGDDALLTWSTASEKDAAWYEILNSDDGTDFKKIAVVNAKGNSSSVSRYSHLIKEKNHYGNYFRLKMTDKDLSYKESEIAFLKNDCENVKNVPEIFYNSATGIVLSSISVSDQSYLVSIADATGKIVYTDNFRVEKGYNEMILKPLLSAGLYLTTLKGSDGTILSKKILISN
jgi:hypothetical protein